MTNEQKIKLEAIQSGGWVEKCNLPWSLDVCNNEEVVVKDCAGRIVYHEGWPSNVPGEIRSESQANARLMVLMSELIAEGEK